MKFVKEFSRNETLGTELRDTLLAHGYKMLETNSVKSEVDTGCVMLQLDTAERNKCRKVVIEFLNKYGYVKRVVGSSGTTYLNFEDNSKRVYYSIESCKYRAEGFDELQDYVSIFLIFETR